MPSDRATSTRELTGFHCFSQCYSEQTSLNSNGVPFGDLAIPFSPQTWSLSSPTKESSIAARGAALIL